MVGCRDERSDTVLQTLESQKNPRTRLYDDAASEVYRPELTDLENQNGYRDQIRWYTMPERTLFYSFHEFIFYAVRHCALYARTDACIDT